MSRSTVFQGAVLAIVLTCGLGAMTAVDAAKPAPPPPPPPPPPVEPADIYVLRADLGGWLDTQRNLVWGYSLTDVSGSTFTYSGALRLAPDYANYLYRAAANYDISGNNAVASANHYQQLADDASADSDAAYLAGDDEEGDRLLALANQYQYEATRRYVGAEERYASADIAYAAAEKADDFTNWRVPTKDEAADACRKKLFTGSALFTPWDLSPYVGTQPATNNLYWTSTTTGKNAYVFRPASGEVTTSSQTSIIYSMVVRTHVP